jgi:hypothetical protein
MVPNVSMKCNDFQTLGTAHSVAHRHIREDRCPQDTALLRSTQRPKKVIFSDLIYSISNSNKHSF